MKIVVTFFLFLFLVSVYPQQKWLRVNGPEGGIVNAFYAKGDTLLTGLGYFSGVIYYSTNQGKIWNPTNFKIEKSILGFTYANDGSFLTCDGTSIFRSTDLINWNKVFSTYLEGFISLGRDGLGTLFGGTNYGGIFQSTDNGLHWIFAYGKDVVPVTNFVSHPNGDVFAGLEYSVLRKRPTSGWFKVPLDSIQNYFILAVFTLGNVYSAVTGNAGLFFTSDTGNNWVDHDTSKYLLGRFTISLVYNKRLIASEYRLETEPGGILLSEDKGYTWRKTWNGLLPYQQPTYLTIVANETFLGTEGDGVYRSTDFGESWAPYGNGMHSSCVIKFIVDNYGNYFTASWQSGISKSTDKGETWQKMNNGFDNCNFYSIISDASNILYAGSDKGVFKSLDNAATWTKVSNNFGYHLYSDDQNSIYVVGNGTELYRSSDQGNSWSSIAPYILSSALVESKGYIYAGGYGGRIYKSTNHGQSWRLVRSGSINSASIGNFCRTSNGYLFANCFYEGVLRSTNDGESWALINSNGTQKGGYAIACNKKDGIYTTTVDAERDGKIFYSSDYGNHWKDVSGALDLIEVRDLVVMNGDSLFLSTHDGLWKSNPDSITVVNSEMPVSKSYYLLQNYPNPFNPTTKIKYSIAARESVTLKVYDILGREIQTLVNEEKPAGEYEVTFSSHNLASGVYIYRIITGSFSDSKRMLLIK